MKEINLDKYKSWLVSDNPDNRDNAIHVIFHSGYRDEEVDNLLISMLLTDDNTKIRRCIAHMFENLNEKKFEDVLFKALKDDDWGVKGHAYSGLIKLGVDKNHNELIQYRNSAIHDFELFIISDSDKK